MRFVITILAAYLFGSINPAILISRAYFGRDVRESGSKNAGATNMARVFGMKAGLAVLLLDALKTAAATAIGWLLLGRIGFCVAGVCCDIGHCFPVFFRFRGGKGVTVGATLGLLIDWRAFLVALAVFILVFLLTHIVSLCSMLASLVLPAMTLLLGLPTELILLSAVIPFVIVVQHRSNIGRLLRGEEGRFSPPSDK